MTEEDLEHDNEYTLCTSHNNPNSIQLVNTVETISQIQSRVAVSREVLLVAKETTNQDCIAAIESELDKELSLKITNEAEQIRQRKNDDVEKFFKNLESELSRPMTEHLSQRAMQMEIAKPSLRTYLFQFIVIFVGGALTLANAISYLEPPNYAELDECKDANWFQTYIYHGGCGGFGIMDSAGSVVGSILETSSDIANVCLPVIFAITLIIAINLVSSLSKDYKKYHIAKTDYQNDFKKITRQNITSYRTRMICALQIIAQNKGSLSKLISEKMPRELFFKEHFEIRQEIYNNITLSLISQVLNLIDTTSKQGIFATDEEHKSLTEKSWKLDQVVANCGVECQQMIGQYKSQAIGGLISSQSMASNAVKSVAGLGKSLISGGFF